MQKFSRYIEAACGLLVLFACSASAQELREEFHQTYALAPEGRISVKNVNGGVHISAWDRNEVKVDAVKSARDRETLGATDIVVEARPDSIEIKTESRDRNHLGNVEYTLMVPRRARLDSIDLVNGGVDVEGVAGDVRARSVNGGIKARGLAGQVDLSTVNGGVSSQFDRLDAGKSVTLKSVNGGVDAALPASAGARLNATTVHGGIQSDFNVPIDRGHVGQRLEATLGAGGAPVSLQTVNGGIRIRQR